MSSKRSRAEIVATYRGATVSIGREEAMYYDNLRTVLRRHFPSISKDDMIIQTKDLDICKGEFVDIPDELWVGIGPRLRSIKIVTRLSVTRPPPETYLGHQAFYGQNEGSALSPKQCYIVATVGANSVFVSRGRVTKYKDLVVTLVCYFPALVEDHAVVQTSGRNIDIPPKLWPDISRDIENIKVISRCPVRALPFSALSLAEIGRGPPPN
ncbi:hypothetical protein ARMSODRAFT_1025699 [Armillaria solidipes]|uniref:Uncharacterized protein n=1 Tax=Armillaria solidipes TaxID=1076256 RepID=A0A2H3ARI1_9AGAR|nr:hypothetical protein ARMSODRAFT_1025699 [Armillaria solidipes]